MVILTNNYTSLVSTLSYDKAAAKKRLSPSKIVSLDVQTTLRLTFLSSELQCLPCGDPKNLYTNVRIRLLATHSLEIAVMASRGDVTRVLHVIEGGVRVSAVKISRVIKIFLTISAFYT